MKSILKIISVVLLLSACTSFQEEIRIIEDFNFDWRFRLGDYPDATSTTFDDTSWRALQLPHDWSIEGDFSVDHPAKPEGGALPTGIAWYRKTFSLGEELKNKQISIEFDGVYRNSEVWINGHYLGKRPNGYIAFVYDLTPYLNFGDELNVIAVKVDNSLQPNSRWYSGSGIYRNVVLVITEKYHVAHWGTYVTTPEISKDQAIVNLEIDLENNNDIDANIELVSRILDSNKHEVSRVKSKLRLIKNSSQKTIQIFELKNPVLWDIQNPYNYSIHTQVYQNDALVDHYETPFGIREFKFDPEDGFSLNGQPMKIHGVCLHHDNGALGAVANTAAIRRKLALMKKMGVNAIRVSHNPSSSVFLNICDEMGFIVQAEAFDVWKKRKVKNDYHLDWDQWHKRDLEDFIKRDRNHPSVMMWSIGNEIREQFDSTGIAMTKELTTIVKGLDHTRPVTCALTENLPNKNFIYQSGVLDILGFNYKHLDYPDFPTRFKGQAILASESASALQTRGAYDHDANEIKRWPPAHNTPFDGHADLTVSAYDQVSAYWGATHEESWKAVKDLDYIAGTFIWTGIDYLGEPIPYPYPARSAYFGIVDLAGLPKDVYYMYQSEWSKVDVLHVFPHWNWEVGQKVDLWVYYNNADSVELFLNGKSLGIKSKQKDDLHIGWKVDFVPGTLKAVSRKNGQVVLEKEIQTAGSAAEIKVEADKAELKKNHYDLSYLTVTVIDKNGNPVPKANNKIHFTVSGGGKLVGVDNGYQANMTSFKAKGIQAFNGKCIGIIQSNGQDEDVIVTVSSDGLKTATLHLNTK